MNERDPGMAERIVREAGVKGWEDQTAASSNPYIERLVDHCQADRSLWHWWELGTFASQIRLYKAYCRIKAEDAALEHLLFIVRKLRNAVSHGCCLLSDVTIVVPTQSVGSHGGVPYDTQVLRQGMWLCGRDPHSKGVRKSSLGKSYRQLIVHNYSTMLYTYLRLVNSHGMFKHSVEDVQKLNKRMEDKLEEYFGRKQNMSMEQNPEVYRTINTLIEIGQGYCARVEERTSGGLVTE